jgi:glycosyltransferase involved in cell wall biosynthesis
MKVTMLVLNDFTHDSRVHREAKTLASIGHEVEILALHRGSLPTTEQVAGYTVRRLVLRTRRWRGRLLAPIAKYLELVREVARVTRLRPADVYHSHNGNTLLATYPVVKRDRAAWVYDSHELETGRNFGGFRLSAVFRWLWPLPERILIHRPDAVISASPAYADQLVVTYGIKRPTVLRNCPEYVAPPSSSVLRQELGISAQKSIILYQGNISFNRGLETCIQSLQYLDTDVCLVMVGDGIARDSLVQLASALNLADRVHFSGFVPIEKLIAYTASADLGLSLIQNTCASYYLTLPNKVMEYIMAGLPVVASDFPAMGQIIRKYDVGQVVRDPTSPQEVAAAVHAVLNDPERYRQMQANAFDAARVLNWEQESLKLIELYRSISMVRG